MMNVTPAARLFPIKGYLLINGLVWAVLATIYFTTKSATFSDVEATVQRPGVSPLLILIALAFAIVSIYDFCFDRMKFSSAQPMAPEDEEEEKEEEKG